MTDFTLNAPGTTNSPWTPANVIVPVSTIKSDATGWRATTAGVAACFAHNVNYGTVITSTITFAAGGTSNGDDGLVGIIVRSGTNAGAGIGAVVSFASIKLASWDKTLAETNISSGVAITRANTDTFSVTVTLSGGTFTITNVTQNGGSPIVFTGNTTTALAAETTLAAGGGFEPFNTNALYLAQFTGTGVSGGGGGTQSRFTLLGVGP